MVGVIMLTVIMLTVIVLTVIVLTAIMLAVVMLTVIMLTVIMLTVVMLTVVGLQMFCCKSKEKKKNFFSNRKSTAVNVCQPQILIERKSKYCKCLFVKLILSPL
jgi:hypothetical protein